MSRQLGLRRCTAGRRRGSALLLVVTILGILFVTGLAFLTTISFESQMIDLEKRSQRDEIGVAQASSAIQETLRSAFVSTPGVPTGAKPMGSMVRVDDPYSRSRPPATWGAFDPDPQGWVELPGVHGLFSPIEPYWYEVSMGDVRMIYPYFTDLDALRNGAHAGTIYENFRFIDTAMQPFQELGPYDLPNATPDPDDYRDPNAPWVVDADGDGIMDSILHDLERLGMPSEEVLALARLVNPPDHPSNRAFVGLRIIPHGGLVNLAEGHPNLIENIMDTAPAALVPYARFWSQRSTSYNPMVEERFLRHRGGVLPPRTLPPTAIQGNPFNTRDPDVPGGGDFASLLFARNENVLAGGHRFHPFTPLYVDDVDYDDWLSRMDAELRLDDWPARDKFDRRHLVTTVSHDNLLARPTHIRIEDPADATMEIDANAFDRMMQVNRLQAESAGCGGDLPFEFPNYPHTIPNGPGNLSWCQCHRDSVTADAPPCPLDVRKGRLKLSLEWLDAAYKGELGPNKIDDAQRIRLIRDTFTMLLLNARGSEWGSYSAAALGAPLEWTQTEEQLREVSRTAAALTANLLDFADKDNEPTEVEVVNANYKDLAKFGRSFAPAAPAEFVMGIEWQPYITEIAAKVDDGDDNGQPDDSSWYAVEVLNPYDVTLSTAQEPFFIQVGADERNATRYKLTDIQGGFYRVLHDDEVPPLPNGSGQKASGFQFSNGDTIYLLRQIGQPGRYAYVVVDQFEVTGGVAKVVRATEGTAQKIERPWNLDPRMQNLATTAPWFAPIPAEAGGESDDLHTLGALNSGGSGATIRPVQVLLANNCASTAVPAANNKATVGEAFPTTGSLLMLMRHANHELGEAVPNGGSVPIKKLAFTTYLAAHRTDTENGRIPIFDASAPDANGLARHHVDPSRNPPLTEAMVNPMGEQPPNMPGDVMHLPWGQLVFDYFTTLPLNNASPWDNSAGKSDVEFWKQQQAAKPRVELDGLRVHGRVDLNSAPWTVLAGLPLTPMTRIPERLRPAIRKGAGLVKGGESNQLVSDPMRTDVPANQPGRLLSPPPAAAAVKQWDSKAEKLGEELAKAIVAYRELRAFTNAAGAVQTGDYKYSGGVNYVSRGWNEKDAGGDYVPPTSRRGTGFLTVGELANVRHTGAAIPVPGLTPNGFARYSPFRMDGGVVGNTTQQEDYVSAVSLLVALSDWASVRSDVYTVYGSIWGEPFDDPKAVQKLEARALRFQETVDRLPTFLGQSAPAGIGERVMLRYNDMNAD